MSESENKEPQNKILYKLGVEFYKNETEKEMDGRVLLGMEVEENADMDALAESVKALIHEGIANTKKIMEAYEASVKSGDLPADAPKLEFGHAHALAWNLSENGTQALVPVFLSGEYWFHLFNADEMAKQRRTMFEKTEAETAEQFQEPSLDAVLGNIDEQPPVDLDAGGLTLTKNFYFSKSGELLNGLPDFWMVKAGLL